jgi:putative N6-adenine-specific DNA methylase
MEKYEIVATTLMGLEEVLAEEIRVLGGENIKNSKRAVSFLGDDSLLYKCNLALQSALRVLVPLDEFYAYTEKELYENTKSVQWEKILSLDHTFSIGASVNGIFFKHSQYAALLIKDAIADRFREKFGKRPSVDKENADITLNAHIQGEKVTLSLDSSGISLNKRGYRIQANEAPINEVLAAGIIKMSGWDKNMPFYDPMSGSGTFSIEAAIMATNTPPGLNRNFSCENWMDFDKQLFEKCKNELKSGISENSPQIFARDLLASNVETISRNISDAGMEDHILLKKEDFFESKPKHDSGMLFLNPPYGERMKIEDLNLFYSKIGDTLKQNYKGFDAWIISSDREAMKKIGLRAEKKIDLMNGGLEARLQKYQLFEGKRF